MAKTWFPVALWAEIAPLFALFASRPKGGRARAEDKLRKSISHATLLAGLSIFESGAMSDEAFAACAGTAPNYVCAGDVTSQQTINGSGLVSVTTTAGFSVNSAGGSALTIYGWDDVSYIDANASSLNSAGGFGLDVHAGPTQIAPVLLTIRTAGDISGASGGIRAENFSIDFAGSVDIKAGDIWSSGGNGLDAASFGSVQIEAGSISAGQTGIYARSYSSGTPAGAIIIKADSVTADQYGIQAIGDGPVSVEVGSVAAAFGTGINITGTTPGTSLSVKTTNASARQYAISTQSLGGATQIVTDGLVQGGVAAISASADGVAPIVIDNLASGILQNVSGLSTDLAVMTQSGPTALTNAGTLTGVLQLAGGAANEIFNQGMWHTAGGSSDFGGSATLTNMAGGTILAGGGTGPVTTAFNNLTGFENSGRLALRGAIVGNMLTTDANVELKAGSEVAIGINTAGGSDRLATSGTLAIGGKLAVSYTDGFGMNTRYTVATADGGVSGRWSAVTAYSAFLGLIDTYDANNAYLTASQIRPFADAGLTRNQIATATALDTMPGSGPLFDALTMQGSDAQARHAFDQLSGEIYSSAKAALVEESRFVREAATGRLRNAFGAVAAPAMAVMSYAADDSRGASGPMPKLPANDRLAVWGHAFGVWGQMDSDHNAASLHRSAGGFLLGADAPVADGWRAGLQTGYSRSHFEAKSRGAKLDSENYHLGVYAGAQWGQLGFRAGLAYTWHRLDATRNIAFEGFGDQARGKYDAGTFQTFGELGYRIDGWGASFEPFVNLASVNVTDDSFNERGGSAALRVDGKTADTAFNTLGLRGSKTFDIGGQRVTLSGMAGWRHAYGDVTPLSRNAFAGGNAFTVAGAPIARDALALEAAADIDLSRAMRIGLRYNGQIASAGDQHSVMANLTLRF